MIIVFDKTFSRRDVLSGMLAGGLLVVTSRPRAGIQSPIVITDIAARRLHLDSPIKRILLGDGSLAYVMALLNPEDPFGDVIGWGDNFQGRIWTAIKPTKERFPRLTASRPSQAGLWTLSERSSRFPLSRTWS